MTDLLDELATTKISHSIIMVDAATAERWLTRNRLNRTVRQTAVARYRSDMESGRWAMTADPIRFDTEGDLVDGQHRLLALSELPDVTLPFLVIRGLPREAQGAMDQGIKRTPGDQLGLRGIRNGHHVASAVKQFIAWEENLFFRDTKVMGNITAPQIEEWVDQHPGDISLLQAVMHLTKQNDAPPSIAAAAAIGFGRIDVEKTVEFFTLLARGAGTEGHPIVTLDKRLQRIRREGIKTPNRDYLALFIQAWNAWRDSRRVTKFYRPSGGRWSEDNFPEPK